MRKLLLAAVVLANLGIVTLAEAASTLRVRVYEDGVQAGNSPSATDGDLSLTRNTANFQISLEATGIPLLAAPLLTGHTTSVSTVTGFTGTHTIRIEIAQSRVPTASATSGILASFANFFTVNFLNNPNGAIASVTIANYANSDHERFDTQTLLASVTYTPAGGIVQSSGPIIGTANLYRPIFSETLIIEATFTGGSAVLQASSRIVGVPEPVSLAMFGVALFGLGLVRRRTA